MFPVTDATLDSYVRTVLNPRRQDPRWQASYAAAYEKAATIWPTDAGHGARDMFAFITADLAMAAAAAQPIEQPPAAVAGPASGITPEMGRVIAAAVAGLERPRPGRRETVAERLRRKDAEGKAALAAVAKMPPPPPRAVLPTGEPEPEPSAAAGIGFAPNVGRAERVSAGWDRAMAKARERLT